MKVLLLGDSHFGVNGDSLPYQQYFSESFEYMFNVAKERNIDTVIHLGDIVDRRKYINFSSAATMRKSLVQPILDMGMTAHFLCGNHDSYYKNTNEVNALRELIHYSNINIYDRTPTEIIVGGTKICMVPWISSDLYEECFRTIAESRAPLCLGHLELNGFEMESGDACIHGYDPTSFKHFQQVYSGHFHQPSSKGNIRYIGAPYQITWSDYEKPRGFSILDTETLKVEFIQNPYSIFHKIIYNDTDLSSEDIFGHDYSQYRSRIVKIHVACKNNLYWFDQFIDGIEQSGAHRVTVIEDGVNVQGIAGEVEIQDIDDTKVIIKKYIDEMQLSETLKSKVNSVLASLHTEASNQGI